MFCGRLRPALCCRAAAVRRRLLNRCQKKTFEEVNRTFFQVPENPENYGPLKETLGVPVRGKLSKSCSWCRRVLALAHLVELLYDSCTYQRREKCREKCVTFKMSPIFFRAMEFFKLAALGNRPSQSFKFSRAPEKIAPRTVVRQKLSPSGRCGAGASAQADACSPCTPNTRQLSS